MKRQDLYPYDSTLLGLNDQYIPMGVDRFYINSPSIIANDHTVISGQSYTIIKAKHEDIIVQPAKLVDVYHDGISLNLIMEDIDTGIWFTLKLSFNNKNHQCPWTLVDIAYLKAVVEHPSICTFCDSL